MKPPPRTTAVRRRLIALLLATGALSVGGGLALAVQPDGHLLRLPTALLASTPFSTYLVPGLVLAIVVGGAQLVAGFALARHHPRGLHLATLGGMILAGWIAIQAMMLDTINWLQPVFFVVAVVELMLVAANVPRQPPHKQRFGAR